MLSLMAWSTSPPFFSLEGVSCVLPNGCETIHLSTPQHDNDSSKEDVVAREREGHIHLFFSIFL